MNIYGTSLRLLGMDVLTDYAPLADLLREQFRDESDGNRESIIGFNSAFPGFIEAVIEGQKELSNKRFRPSLITYFNFRVQVWVAGLYDADPSALRRCLPAGVLDESTYNRGPSIH